MGHMMEQRGERTPVHHSRRRPATKFPPENILSETNHICYARNLQRYSSDVTVVRCIT